MFNDLLLFLETNVNGYSPNINDKAVQMLRTTTATTKRYLEHKNALDGMKHPAEAESIHFPDTFDIAYQKISQNKKFDSRTVEVFWAHLLVDSALLQALQFTVGMDGSQSELKVLNNLDRATIIGGASGDRLRWIHRMIEHIEGPMCDILDRKIDIPSDVPCKLEYLVDTYSAEDIGVLRFQRMIQDKSCSHPFIIKNAIGFWPAFNERPWTNLEYLRVAVGKHRLVPIELGSKYTDESWTPKLMPFGQFLDTIVYPSASAGGRIKPGYLAQHDLFSQAFRLKRDFSLPDYTLAETGRRNAWNSDDVQTNVWLGPQGTISPLHYDPYDNLFAQVVGCKYFRLYSPSESSKLYPHSAESLLSNTSQVDLDNVNTDNFPLFSKAQYCECVVYPGDLLYIPPEWWHYVRSLSISVSISMWF